MLAQSSTVYTVVDKVFTDIFLWNFFLKFFFYLIFFSNALFISIVRCSYFHFKALGLEEIGDAKLFRTYQVIVSITCCLVCAWLWESGNGRVVIWQVLSLTRHDQSHTNATSTLCNIPQVYHLAKKCDVKYWMIAICWDIDYILILCDC